MKKYEYTLYRTKSLAKFGECPAGVQVMASPWLWGRYCYCKLVGGGEGGKVRSSKVGCVPDTLDGIVHIVHSRNCRPEEADSHCVKFSRDPHTVCCCSWLPWTDGVRLVFGCINCRHGNSVGYLYFARFTIASYPTYTSRTFRVK